MSSTPSRRTPSWPELGKFWTVPNVLSMMRVLLVLPIMYLILIDGSLLWLLILCVLAIASDYFDGRLARWSHTVSDWGKVLDPLADKVGGALVVLALVIRGSLPAWLLLLVIARDVLIVLGGILLGRRTGLVLMSIWSGKVAVTALAITSLAALLRADPEIMQFCIWTTTVLLVYSFLRYIIRYLQLSRRAALEARMIQAQTEEEAGSIS